MRWITGFICSVVGLAGILLHLLVGVSIAFLFTGLGFLFAGLFQIFEARKGWCALRAMGIKTPV